MQFVCDSCKAMLQIADEKVRGKRLVVRCKKCGAKITISDPGLGAPVVRAALKAEPVAQPAPERSAPQPPAAAPSAAESERDSDTESTRAMDSDLLEKALQASKREELPAATTSPGGAAPQASRAPERESQRAAAAQRGPAPQRELAVWFAMLGGKQTGPLSRTEIDLKTAQGAVGPRTYLWKEGMASWTRAKDVAEVAALFAPEPNPPQPAPGPALGTRELSASGAAASGAAASGAAASVPAALRPSPFGSTSSGGRPSGTPQFALTPSGDAPGGAAQSGPALSGSAPPGSVSSAPADSSQRAAPGPAAESRQSSAPRQEAGQLVTPVPGGDEPLRPVPLASHDDDPTNVEQLPNGERVHQERVAAELFNSGEISGQSALELARWASSELGKQRPSSPELARATARRAGPFSQVPESPALAESAKVDRTGEVLAFAGVQRSRTPLLIALAIGGLLVGGVLLWALSGDSSTPAKVETGQARPADAGTPPAPSASTGDPAIAALAAKAAAAPASGDRAGDRPAKKKPDALTSNQQADLKSLANERGVGTHGPSAAQVAETPDVEKADVGLTADDVRKKLGQSKGALQGCIDEALRREPNLRVGKIHIATTIAPSGSVTATKIDKQTVDQSLLGTCLKRATRRIVFPSFQGEAFEVDIPIVVTAGD